MKVTFISKEYPPNVYGGAGVHIRYLSEALSKIMEVEVRCFGDQDVKRPGLTVKGYQASSQIKPTHDPKFKPAIDTVTTDLEILCDGIDGDIVHSHTWYAHLGGFWAKLLYGMPFVATSHSLEPLRPWKEDQLGRAYHLSTWIEKTGLEGADAVIAVSNMMKADIAKLFATPDQRLHVIHNGVNLETWNPTPISDALKQQWGIRDDYILFVGRPTPQKGMEYLVDAADQIDPGVQIVFGAVGADTKEYEDRMKEKVAKKKNILWINKLLKEEEYIQLYSSAKVFVCPSVYEPFGIINLEAMACATPVVATATGGIVEVVLPEETGLLVEPRNAQQIADSVNRILKDEQLARKLGQNGRRRVEERFSWTYIAEQTKRLYEQLLSKK